MATKEYYVGSIGPIYYDDAGPFAAAFVDDGWEVSQANIGSVATSAAQSIVVGYSSVDSDLSSANLSQSGVISILTSRVDSYHP